MKSNVIEVPKLSDLDEQFVALERQRFIIRHQAHKIGVIKELQLKRQLMQEISHAYTQRS
tara:strand:- start:1037 stop:1216 length:180 start_codon:yes stop_codon:yes gene_type:complete